MLLDIDGFKRVNDSWGHECGDCVLAQFAQRVRDLVGEQGLVARIGGEEFAVAMLSATPQEGQLLAEKIRRGVAAQTLSGAAQDQTDPQHGAGVSSGRRRTDHRAV